MSRSGRLNLSWKVVVALSEAPPLRRPNIVFKLSPNTGLFGQFGVPAALQYVPFVLSPTSVFHQVLRNLLKDKFGIEVVRTQFPYRISVPKLGSEVDLKLKVRLYLPNVLSVTVALSPVPAIDDVNALIGLQNLDALEPLSHIVRWTLRIAGSLNHKAVLGDTGVEPSAPFKPFIHLEHVSSADRFADFVREKQDEYVSVLIRHTTDQPLAPGIIQRVLAKNSSQNEKSSARFLLIDKQGIVCATPLDFRSDGDASRLPRVHDLQEIAIVFRTFLENYRQLRATGQEDLADFFFYKIRTWIERTEVVFHNSVTNRHIWSLLGEELSLRAMLDYALVDLDPDIWKQKSAFFDRFAVGWWEKPDFGDLLSGAITESKDLRLGFIDNVELKRSIIEDYQEARRSLIAKDFKAAIVLCGSIAEAVLVFVVQKSPTAGLTQEQVYNLSLFDLIKTAKERNLIADTTLLSYLDPLREFRNLIHPAVMMRKKMSVDSSKASIAFETVKLLVKELDRHRPILDATPSVPKSSSSEK